MNDKCDLCLDLVSHEVCLEFSLPACEVLNELCFGNTHQPVRSDLWLCEYHGHRIEMK